MKRLRPPAALVMSAMIALAGAGCGGGGGGADTAASAGTRGDGPATTRERAVRFAECMRAEGVRAFPDPDASGDLTIDAVANGGSVDMDSAAFAQALAACRHLEPPGFTGGEVTPEQRTARLAFARCVRDSGVPDFPDPTADGPLVDTNRIPSAATADGMANLNAAMQECGTFASAAGVRASR